MAKWWTSAAYRIAFANFAAYAAGLAILAAVVLATTQLAFSRQLDGMVSDEAHELQRSFAAGGEQQLARDIAAREASTSTSRMNYAVFTPEGRRIYGSLEAKRPATGLHTIHFYDPDEGDDLAHAYVVDLSPRDRLVVAVDSEWFESIQDIVILIFTIAALGALLVAFGGAILLGSYLRRRLNAFTTSAEAIIGGDIRRRMPIGPRSDEFDRVAATLNRMLDRVESLLENLRQVSSDIAHDLRTPLARLRNHLERGAAEGGPAALFTDAVQQLDEVLSLFSAILRLSEIESRETGRQFAQVDLSAVLTELAESYGAAFEDRDRSLRWTVEPRLGVEGDRELLAQAVINLLENALRHTPDGTAVRLTAREQGSTACIEVADNGPGVPATELANITKRFARLECSRNTAGHGLGLSLVSAVAELHGGKLVLTDAGPGLCAQMQIPRSNRSSPAARAA
jgi:hypothetical protein